MKKSGAVRKPRPEEYPSERGPGWECVQSEA